jgi:hypothetical protein
MRIECVKHSFNENADLVAKHWKLLCKDYGDDEVGKQELDTLLMLKNAFLLLQITQKKS